MKKVAVSLLLLVAALSACIPAPKEWQGEGTKVVVFGDSLTWWAEHGQDGFDAPEGTQLLTDALIDAGFSASVNAVIGHTANDGSEILAKWDENMAPPDIVVVAYGSNDLHNIVKPDKDGQTTTQSQVQQDYLNFVSQFQTKWPNHTPCVVMVNVHDRSETWGLDVNGPEFNFFVTGGLAAIYYPIFQSVDWDAVASDPAHADMWETDPDLVHFDQDEQDIRVYRDLLVNGAIQCQSSM